MVRAILKKSITDKSWREKFDLHLGIDALNEMIDIEVIYAGNTDQGILLSRLASGHDVLNGVALTPYWSNEQASDKLPDRVKFHMNLQFLEGVEVVSHTVHPSEPVLFTLYQYFSLSVLYRSLFKLQTYLDRPLTKIPMVSKSITDKFESMGLKKLDFESQMQALKEPVLRVHIIQALIKLLFPKSEKITDEDHQKHLVTLAQPFSPKNQPYLNTLLPTRAPDWIRAAENTSLLFVTDSYAETLAKFLSKKPEIEAKALKEFTSQLKIAQIKYFQYFLARAVLKWGYPITKTIDPEQLTKVIRSLIRQAVGSRVFR